MKLKIKEAHWMMAFWVLVGLFTMAAGLAHIIPQQLAGLVSIQIVFGITIQHIAGVAALLSGILMLAKAVSKKKK